MARVGTITLRIPVELPMKVVRSRTENGQLIIDVGLDSGAMNEASSNLEQFARNLRHLASKTDGEDIS